MKNLTILLLSIFINVSSLNAQSYNDYNTKPGKENQSVASTSVNFENIDLSSGVIKPSIHLVTLRGNSTSVSVDLAYLSGQGVKVEDVASRIGLGWELIAGGFISREVKDKKDEQVPNPNYNTDPLDKPYNVGWTVIDGGIRTGQRVEDAFNLSQNSTIGNNKEELAKFCYLGYFENSNNCSGNLNPCRFYDTEPDLFTFSVGNLNGSFVFDEAGIPRLIPQQDIKIEPLFGANPTTYDGVPAWVITAPDGTKYIFENSSTYTETVNVSNKLTGSGSSGTMEYISKWNLKKIVGVDGDEITFSYNSLHPYSKEYYAESQMAYVGGGNPSWAWCPGITNNTTTVLLKNKKELSQINSSFGRIDFINGTDYRVDMPYGTYLQYPLKYIKFYEGIQNIKTYEFETGYYFYPFQFNYSLCGPPPVDYANADDHLRLDKIIETSINGTWGSRNDISFTYFPFNPGVSGCRLPFTARYSQDWWGFYTHYASQGTGCSSTSTLYKGHLLPLISYTNNGQQLYGNSRDANEALSKEMILKSVEYSTGSKTNLDYEINQVSDGLNPNYQWGGLRIKNITTINATTNAIIHSKSFNYDFLTTPGMSSASHDNLKQLYEERDIEFTNGTTEPYVLYYSHSHRVEPKNLINYENVTVTETGMGKTSYIFTNYWDQHDEPALLYQVCGDPASCSSGLGIPLQNDPGITHSDKSFTQGIVKRILHYKKNDLSGDYDLVKEINYDYNWNLGISRHDVKALRIALQKLNSGQLEVYFYPSFPNVKLTSDSKFKVAFFDYFNMNYKLMKTSIKTYECNNGIVNLSKFILEETENEYDSQNSYLSIKQIKTKVNGIYKDAVKFNYAFDYLITNLQKAGASQSSNPVINGLWQLYQKNCKTTPVEVLKYVFKDGDWKIISGALTFNNLPNPSSPNVIRPFKTLSFNRVNPIDISNFTESVLSPSGVNFNFDSRYEEKVDFNKYDYYGNLMVSQPKYGLPESNLYSYGTKYLVAKILNGKVSDGYVGNTASYSGLESNQTSAGSFSNENYWDLPIGSAGSVQQFAHTGERSFRIDKATAQVPIQEGPSKWFQPEDQSSKFKFSVWVHLPNGITNFPSLSVYITDANLTTYSNNTQLAYATMPISSDGWQYIEVVVDLAAFRNQNSIGSGVTLKLKCSVRNADLSQYVYVDDLRFQSSESSIVSYTYNQTWGKLASTLDNNGRAIYNEYDDWGRLEWVLNNEHLVLKHYSYNVLNTATANGKTSIVELTCVQPHTKADVQSYLSNTPLVFNSHYTISTSYFDEMLRPLQEIDFGQSPNQKDIVSFHEYDYLGKESFQFLPYSDQVANNNFKSNAHSDQTSFYQNAISVAHDNFPFSFSEFENSPSSHMISTRLPGYDPTGSVKQTNNFLLNDLYEVCDWHLTVNGAIQMGNTNPHAFYKSELKDEQGNTVLEFRNHSGRLLCKKIWALCERINGTTLITYDYTNGANGVSPPVSMHYNWITTEYIYNDIGQLVYELPPSFTDFIISNQEQSFTESDQMFKDYVICYKYDERGNQISKQLPGSVLTEYVYDKSDRIILSRDSKQIAAGNNEWNFVKYDKLDRPIMSGLYKAGVSTRNDMQWIADNWSGSIWEDRQPSGYLGYSNNSFPNIQTAVSDLIYTVSWYDDYRDWTDVLGFAYQPYQNNEVSYKVSGLQTGNAVLLVDGSTTPHYLYTCNYYDKKGQLIQSQSQNHLNGWDVYNNVYDFSGKTYYSNHHNIVNVSGTSNSIDVSNHYLFDHSGRLITVYQKTGDDLERIIEHYAYNELGQLIKKSVHCNNTFTDCMQNIDYRYNIRGQLTSINNSSLMYDGDKNFDDNDAFGEEIYYNNVDGLNSENLLNNTFKAIPQLSGNIAAIKWKTKSPTISGEFVDEHMYVYRYDELARMTGAYYTRNDRKFAPDDFNTANGEYNEIPKYDLMGNIIQMKRNAKPGEIDMLNYTYQGNQLLSIEDLAIPQIHNDYHSGPNNTYEYDENGSLKKDNNKNLTIINNYLNLPVRVQSGADNVTYVYDAMGTKIKRISPTETTDYIAGMEFKNGVLQFISTTSGRVRPKGQFSNNVTQYVYDYFLMDHVSNVRAVLTEEVSALKYEATMEVDKHVIEEQLFENVPGSRAAAPAEISTDPTIEDEVSRVNDLKPIGHAKTLQLVAGDEVSLQTKYFFRNYLPDTTNTRPINDILISLVNSLVPGYAAGTLTAEQIIVTQQTFLNNAGLVNFLTTALGDTNPRVHLKPQAFLTWIYFDRELNFVPEMSGVLQAQNDDQLSQLSVLQLRPNADGYLYVYVSNESRQEVNFDHLTITHNSGRLLEINNYYPYGLLIEPLSFTSPAYLKNNLKYNSIEQENKLGENMYGAALRGLDPVIGRWWQPDPMTESFGVMTPYNSNLGNPVLLSDPNGDCPMCIMAGIGAITGTIAGWRIADKQHLHGNAKVGTILFGTIIGTLSGFIGYGAGSGFAMASGMATAEQVMLSAAVSASISSTGFIGLQGGSFSEVAIGSLTNSFKAATIALVTFGISQVITEFGIAYWKELNPVTRPTENSYVAANLPMVTITAQRASATSILGSNIPAYTGFTGVAKYFWTGGIKDGIKYNIDGKPMQPAPNMGFPPVPSFSGFNALTFLKSIKNLNGFTEHGLNQAITRGFTASNIIKIVRDGKVFATMGRYGSQIKIVLGENTVVIATSGSNAGKIVTVFSTAKNGIFVP